MVTKSYYMYIPVLFLESVRKIVNRYQVHERSENYGGIGFETSLLLAKPIKKTPLFKGDIIINGSISVTVYSCIM